MACPWFYPVERMTSGGRNGMPLPLGDAWSGFCHAAGGSPWTPDPPSSRQFCNFGYAREKCPRCPTEGPDAVRFAISKDREGVIGILWVVEKDHLPFAHGKLEYSRAEGRFPEPSTDALVAQQAYAYVSSYLHRKGDR